MSTLVLSFLNGTSSFLQVTRTTIKAWMSLNFCQIRSPTTYWVRCPWAFEKLMSNVVSTGARSFLIESYSFLLATRTAIKAWMGSKFGKIWPGSTELAALECLIKNLHRLINGRNVESSLVLSFLNESSPFLQVTRTHYKSMNEFEFLPDPITNYWVSGPWVFEKWMYNVVSTGAPSFLIGSYSFLLVKRTAIKAWMGLKFSMALWS